MKDLAQRVKKKLPHKQTQEATYFARSILEASESSLLESLLHIVGSKRLYEHDWNVLKIYNDGSRASLLWYPELNL